VLAAQGVIPYRTFIFANVGDHAESPDTIRYVAEVLKPYAQQHGVEWIDVQRTARNGQVWDLYLNLYEAQRSVPIPAFMPGGMPGTRQCTDRYKIKPIARWIKKHAPGCTLGKGISTDEPARAKPGRESDAYISAYPLIELGYSREDCLRVAREARLPQPPKSSCWFCPFKTSDQWVTMRQERPEMFRQAVDLEQHLQQIRARIGKDPVYLSSVGGRKELNLEQAIPDQLGLFPAWYEEQHSCESGYCMT